MAHDALGAHARDELGIFATTRARPVQAALASGAAFSIGAILPLLVAIATPEDMLGRAVTIASLLCLALLGVVAAKTGGSMIVEGGDRVRGIERLRRCELMVTNDTGPMHAAAALGKPLAALFGPTEPRRTGPYGHLEDVLRLDLPCSPCLKSHCTYEKPNECLKAISPAMAFQWIQALFPLK